MDDREALYATILAHPDEDTPRLVFADWLEENGDARYAAFIRKQIELAKVSEWDPLWVRAWYRDRDALTGRGFDRFVPKVPELVKWPALTSFRRGLPWHIESTVGPFLEHADRLFAAIPLQALTVRSEYERWRDPIDLTELFASPYLARLDRLSFSLTRLTVETVQRMQACPHLGNLTAMEFRFANFDPGALQALLRSPLIERMESLSFESGSVAWGDLAAGISGAGGPHRLRNLAVTSNSAARFSAPQIFGLPLLHGLKELEISGHEMGADAVRALCSSPIAGGLESLALNKTKPGVTGIRSLGECAALSGLKRLQLRSNYLGPVAAKTLAGSSHLSAILVLDLTNNLLGDKGAIALAEAPFMADVLVLELMHCEIGDVGAQALMDGLSADKLVYLNLHSSAKKISDGMKKKLRDKFGGRLFT